MRGSRKNSVPGRTLISLGSKPKRSITDLSRGSPPIKKPRPDVQEVNPAELVSRVEALVSSGNTAEADTILLSALSHLRSSQSAQTLGLGSSRPGGFGASSSSSRLPAALSLGLLVLGRTQSSLFSRPAIQDQLTELLTHAPRGFNATLPPAVVATIAARSRGLHVLAANLLMVALTNQQKWPSKLVKAYLEDSLSDRIWVDLDECKAFVLNIETAFPSVLGDPKGLFTVLCSSAATGGGSSGTPGSGGNSSGSGFSTQPVQAALYLTTPLHQGQRPPESGLTARSLLTDLTDAINTVLGSHSVNTAKIVHGGDPGRLVSPRFESSRAAVEVIIVHTLREALARRSGSGGTTVVATSSGASDSGSNTSLSVLSSGEVIHTRCLIRTLGLAAGIPELRSLTSLRLEPWLTNPKLQILGAGLFAIIATNCRLGTLSPYDVDVMVTIIYRIRLKLLKSNIQSSVLESVCRLALANSSNLTTMITLCLAGELPTTASTIAESGIKQQTAPLPLPPSQGNASTSPSARSVSETVKVLCSSSSSSGADSHPSELQTATVAAVAAGAAEAVGHGHSSAVALILPKLYQRFPSQVVKALGEILHDRIVDAVTADTSLPLDHPSDSDMVTDCVTLMAPMRRFLRDLTKWVRMAAAAGFNSTVGADSQAPTSGSGGAPPASGFLPCAELGYHLLHLDRTTGFSTFPEAAATITQRLLAASKKAGQEGFSPFLVLRYICAVVHILCQLQLLSATRLNWYEAPTSKKKSSGTETMKLHLSCVRQLRLNFLRWFKSFLPHLISTCAPHFPPTSPRDAFAGLVHLLRRALFLEAAAPLDQAAAAASVSSSDCEMDTVCHFSDFYAADELLPSSQDQTHFVSLLTYVTLPEKLAHQVLLCGLESHRGLLSAADAAAVVCELIWRATALSMDSSFEPANFNKPEQLIDLLYACCAYCTGQGVPSELSELAHSGTYWKVSLALVALAANLPKTCGAHLWLHYPTVRRLMEMVITNNFVYPPLTHGQNSDTNAVESERLNREMETQLIIQLESRILLASKEEDGASEGDKSTAIPSTSEQSKLIGQLVRNNPRGACRCPPQEQLAILRSLCETLSLRRRLCTSRQPDFLLELIRSQGQGLPQSWLLDLVESVGCSMDALPQQCLSEYLLYDTATRIQCADEKAFANFDAGASSPPHPLLCLPRQRTTSQGSQPMDTCSDSVSEKLEEKVRSRRHRLESTSSTLVALEKPSDNSVRSLSSAERWRLQCRIVDRLRVQARCPPATPVPRPSDLIAGAVTGGIGMSGSTAGVTSTTGFSPSLGPSDDNIAEAVLQSFAYRLKDASSVIRRAAWHCLALLTVEDSSAIQLGQDPVHPNKASSCCLNTVEGRLTTLQELLGLVGLSVPLDNPTLTTPTEMDPCAVNTASHRIVEFRCLILDSLLAAILVESELLPLTTYILFVGQLTEYPDFTAWRPVMTCFGQLLLTRRSLVHNLLTSSAPLEIEPYSSIAKAAAATTGEGVSGQAMQILRSSGFTILEVIASIFVRDIDYYCTSAEAIPVDEKNSVFVAWSAERECPMELETLESHLVLLSCVPRSLSLLKHSWPAPTAWWIRLLDTWFRRLEGDKPRYAFPHMASLAATEETMRTPRGLLTFNPAATNATQSACPLTLAPELRSAFLLTDQPQMVCVALDGLETEELVNLVRSTPPLLLSRSTANQLVDLLSKVPEAALARTAGVLRLLNLRAQMARPIPSASERRGIALTESHVFEAPSTIVVSTGTPNARPSTKPPPQPSAGRPRTADGKNLWRDLISRLSVEVGSSALKSFSSVLTKQLHSAACRSKWIIDLSNELNSGSEATSSRCSSTSSAFIDQLLGLPEPHLRRMLCLMFIVISKTAGADEKLLSRQQITRELCISRFERALEGRQNSPAAQLVRQIMLEPLQRAKRRPPGNVADLTASCSFSLSCADEAFLRLPLSRLIDPAFGSLEQRLQLLTLFGFSGALPPSMRAVSMLKMDSPGDNESQLDLDNFWSLVRSIVFSETDKRPAFDAPVRRFLLEELVHNAVPSIVRFCLRKVLHEDVSLLSSSQVLDFATTLLNLPTFASPVPLAEPHERPDAGTFYSSFHQLTDPIEALHLLLYILSESLTNVKLQGRNEKVLSVVESQLSARAALFDLALQSWPRLSVMCLEVICGFADASPANLPPNLFQVLMPFIGSNPSDLRQHAQNFLICVYLRRPGLKYLLTSPKAHVLISQSSAACRSLPACFEQSEIDRLGPSFLIGLSGSQEAVRDMSAIASCTLAISHPRACLRLLPLAAGLTQGRLESASTGGLISISWTKFVSRYHLDFYLGLLHFMELLAFQTPFDAFIAVEEHMQTCKPVGILFSSEAEAYRHSIDRILVGLIHVTASYPNHARKMSGLSVRLARLLQAYAACASWAFAAGSLLGPPVVSPDGNAVVVAGTDSISSTDLLRTRSEMLRLANQFNEFSSFTGLLSPAAAAAVSNAGGGGGGIIPPPSRALLLPFAPPKPAKQCNPSTLRPFIQRLSFSSDSDDILGILMDLDRVSERKLDVLQHFQGELERLVTHDASSPGSLSEKADEAKARPPAVLALKLLFRLLRLEPQRAATCLETVYLPCLLFGAGREAELALLPEACLLAPQLAPRLLRTAAVASLLVTQGCTASSCVRAVSEALLRLTLDGLDVACIEHAASGLLSTASGPKFTPT